MKKILIALITGSLFIPIAAYAVEISDGINSLGGLVDLVTRKILNSLITLFATAALVAFFFGMVRFILASRDGDTTKISNGKQFMLWSVIALFVMFSIWGIVNYAQTIFGFSNNNITIPQIVLPGSSGTTNNGSNSDGGLSPTGNATYYTCPDGVTRYYNQSDYRVTCGGTAATSCASYTTAAACQAASCSWSDADRECSQ